MLPVNEKVYVMYNESTKARIKCTEKYVARWMSMGFVVEEVILPTKTKEG